MAVRRRCGQADVPVAWLAVGEQLLDRLLREIRERMDASRAAVEESRRLEVALEALGWSAGDGHAQSAASPRGTRAQKVSVRQRAPRGQNLRRIREVIDERYAPKP